MATRVMLEIADTSNDGSPEIFFYVYRMEDAAQVYELKLSDFDEGYYATSSDNNGRYDELINTDKESADADGDGDGGFDKHDKRLYLQLADAFAQFKGFQDKR